MSGLSADSGREDINPWIYKRVLHEPCCMPLHVRMYNHFKELRIRMDFWDLDDKRLPLGYELWNMYAQRREWIYNYLERLRVNEVRFKHQLLQEDKELIRRYKEFEHQEGDLDKLDCFLSSLLFQNETT